MFDIVFATVALLLLLPVFCVIAIWVKFDSKGPVFYKQNRVGINGTSFKIFKFRSMRLDADKHGLLTIGSHDARCTRSGVFLRKYKLDELPQLLNVLIGNMSVVGPRPEVRKYVDLYTITQQNVLTVKPGITDFASLAYFEENKLLSESTNPENAYITDIMPKKIELNLKYINERNFLLDLKIVLRTMRKVLS
jgi:lipopolysaccharide/colanic/teichoic acid biosynthesis glycosyltransferase